MTGAVCAVVPADPGLQQRANRVAKHLALPLARPDTAGQVGVALVVAAVGGWLQAGGPKAPGPVTVDFADPAMRHRRKGGQNELLGRAVGVKADRKPVVFDATAGLGRDAFVLADLGCKVTLCERSSILAWLLEEAIETAMVSGFDQVRIASERMQVVMGDCRQQQVAKGQVIYLDPMFPERRSSAAVKKDLSVLQSLLAGDESVPGEELMAWALRQQPDRIVVKRPLKAAPLTAQRPSFALKGKAIRFDVYVC